MRIIIEFCRSRRRDEALALIERLERDASTEEAAIALARRLAHSRQMPQKPDLFRILNQDGVEIFREALASPA